MVGTQTGPKEVDVGVVDKKVYEELGNKNRRLLIDFPKLNGKAVDGKYEFEPVKRYREKTAFSTNNGKYEVCRLRQ